MGVKFFEKNIYDLTNEQVNPQVVDAVSTNTGEESVN